MALIYRYSVTLNSDNSINFTMKSIDSEQDIRTIKDNTISYLSEDGTEPTKWELERYLLHSLLLIPLTSKTPQNVFK